MPCGCVGILIALITPRLGIILLALFSNYLSQAFSPLPGGILWPILGFVFLPYTTLALTLGFTYGTRDFNILEVALVVVAFLADIGSLGGSEKVRRERVVYVKR